MRLFLRLFGMQLNQRLGISAVRSAWRDDRKRAFGRIGIFLAVILSVGTLVGLYTWMIWSMMPAFHQLGLEKVFLGMTLLVSMVLVFIMGMVYLIGVLFFSKDTEFLAALPIPQRTVFAAKFGQVLVGEIGTTAVILLPSFIVYGITAHAGAAFWVRAVPTLLLAPCIPLALSGFLSLLLMRFNALWRKRELLTTIGSVLMLVVIFAVQGLLTNKMPEVMSQEAILALISNSSGMLQKVVSAFPPSGWAAEGLVDGGGMLLLFMAASLAALALVMWIAGRIYYGGAMAQLETASSRKAVRITGKAVRQRGAMGAMFLREWRVVLRSPIYALNGLIVIILGPLLLLLPVLFGGMSSEPEIQALMDLLASQVDTRLILLILAGVFALIGIMNPAASTIISREGTLFYLLRLIPVSPRRQVMAKYLFAFSVSLLAMLMMGITSVIVLRISWWVALAAAGLGLLVAIAPMALAMIPDVMRPKLAWNSETEAIKQNMNGILGMLIGWGYVALVGFGCYQLVKNGGNADTLIAVIAGASALLGAASLWGLGMAAKRSWQRIEG